MHLFFLPAGCIEKNMNIQLESCFFDAFEIGPFRSFYPPGRSE